MNGKIVGLIVVGLAVMGLLFTPAALAYSDALKGATGGDQALAVSPTKKVSPTPKKVTPTPIMKMQVTLANTTPTPMATAPARHSYVQGVPKSNLGEPLGIGIKNVSPTPSRYQSVIPTVTPRPL